MKIILFAFTLQFFVAAIVPAQSFSDVRREVLRELTSLKPRNTKEIIYSVQVPRRQRPLPSDLRLDIVYKVGHYSFKYVVLRFKRTNERSAVSVTRFAYGSALDFWKPYAKEGDIFAADSMQMPAVDFSSLIRKAVTYFDSDIVETDIPRRIRRKDGVWVIGGVGGRSMTLTSGDGNVSFRLSAPNASKPLLEGSGSLVSDVRRRASNGYDFIRANLFWNVFDKYILSVNSFIPLPDSEGEALAISRLGEANLFTSYHDYYRQAAYVEFLGAKGTAAAIPVLEKVSTNNGLEPDWNKYLAQDAACAISKIRSR